MSRLPSSPVHGEEGSRRRRDKRFAAIWMNLILPGAGQIYLGQRWRGTVIALTFLGCLGGLVTLILKGFLTYVDVAYGGPALDAERLERLPEAFHLPWLVVLVGLTALVAGLSIALLFFPGSSGSD